MLTDKKRKTIIFLIAVMQNLVFFVVSYFTKLPLWLDTTGTIYISILLGYQFGFCVGLINILLLYCRMLFIIASTNEKSGLLCTSL